MAEKKASNLVVRLLTAVVAVPLLLALLYRGPAWGFFALGFCASLVGVWELLSMTHRDDTAAKLVGTALGGAVSFAVYNYTRDPRVLLTVLVALPILGGFVTLARLGDVATTALRSLAIATAPLFVAVPITLLAVLRRDLGADGPGYVILSMMFAWLSDTGGYFAGRFLGKHKLYEAVSPKKTIEGAVGGLAAAALGGCLAHFWFLPSLPLAHAIVLAVVAGALGQAGDLSESLIKRSTGVKDSGQIVPGHGGILDRVDALIVTGTVVYLYTLWGVAPGAR